MAVTIRDIAAKSGYACSTVSRVLNGNSAVSSQARFAIKKIIEEMNYRPSSIARGLVTGRMNIVFCIIGDRWNPFYAELAIAAEDALNQKGFLAVLGYTNYESTKEEKYIQAAIEYNFAGVIMVTAPQTQQLIDNIGKLNCPVVLANRYLASYPTDVVLMDNYHGGYIATRHLTELGHRRIAHLSGPENSTASQDRLRGYRDAMSEAGLTVYDGDVYPGCLMETDGYRFGLYLLDKDCGITAAFCGNDMMAQGVVKAYTERGKSIPADLSIVGFDDSPVAIAGPVKLTTIRQHPQDMGKAAADMVLSRMSNDAQPHRRVVFTPELVVRDSAVGTSMAEKA